MMKKTFRLLTIASILCFLSFAIQLQGSIFAERPPLDVPFVPTVDEVVKEMIRIAEVRQSDIVYDLGCGDGRIVITAAKETGCAGVGIDIDPARIQESRANAVKAGVADRVTFHEQNLFDADIRNATVVTMYLLPDVNQKIRPKLLKELKPGTRIVSHNYHLDPWKPDKVSKVGYHTVYYWVVPGHVEGVWKISMRRRTAVKTSRVRLDQQFQVVQGRVEGGYGLVGPIRDAEIRGNRISFSTGYHLDGRVMPARFEGRLNGDTIRGRMTIQNEGAKKIQAWKAVREPLGSARATAW
ncbi:MAG TPA: methyltransferase domain-containing protein [Syntrophales bacterium]|nr:methyltransferase domain-containing protein [Syntrophales bacterium]